MTQCKLHAQLVYYNKVFYTKYQNEYEVICNLPDFYKPFSSYIFHILWKILIKIKIALGRIMILLIQINDNVFVSKVWNRRCCPRATQQSSIVPCFCLSCDAVQKVSGQACHCLSRYLAHTLCLPSYTAVQLNSSPVSVRMYSHSVKQLNCTYPDLSNSVRQKHRNKLQLYEGADNCTLSVP